MGGPPPPAHALHTVDGQADQERPQAGSLLVLATWIESLVAE